VFDIDVSRRARGGAAFRVLATITDPRVIVAILARRQARAPPPVRHCALPPAAFLGGALAKRARGALPRVLVVSLDVTMVWVKPPSPCPRVSVDCARPESPQSSR